MDQAPPEPSYTLTLTLRQAQVLQQATEVLARLGIGQFRDALECLPLKEVAPPGWHQDMDDIGAMLARHTISGVDGWRSSLSFLGGATPELSKIAWDLHQVLRRRLAWDRAVAEGLVASADAPRRCPEMMQVSYDDAPLRASSQPLATLAKAACEADETLASDDRCSRQSPG
jgi:hypothetical protein